MGGISKAFIGRVADFTTISTPIAVPLVYADRVNIVDPHVLALDKKVIEISIMYDKSSVESPSAGVRKGIIAKPKVTLVTAGNEADLMGLVDLIKNDDLLIFTEPQEDGIDAGYLIQVGTEALPASLTSHAITTGTSPEGEKMITLIFEAASRTGYYRYTADLPRVGIA